MLTDYKITNGEITANGVQSLPDKMNGSAAENKKAFDKLVQDIVASKLNGLIDEIVNELRMKMAAPGDYGAEGQYLQTNGDGTVTWATPSGAGDMQRSVYDPNADGVVENAVNAVNASNAGNCTGNAATASKLATARSIQIQDADGTNIGEAVLFDGSTGRVLKLPATIKATIRGNVSGSSGSCTGNAASATYATNDAAGRKIDESYSQVGHKHAAGDVSGAESGTLGVRRVLDGTVDINDSILSQMAEGDIYIKREA